ncbi:MAG: pyridine nucleotide-disulfide oxidoreductase, partial [Agrococcus casei]
AIGFLIEVAEVAETHWFTRREPEFVEGGHSSETLTLAVEGVDARVREGLLPVSVVAATGLSWTPALLEAKRKGILERQSMFTRIDETGVTLADGSHQELDTIIWATGFRQNIEHLAPLRLRGPGGGIRMDPPMVADEPRIYLVGYGPSASTIGANRAGRAAVRSLSRYLDAL